MGPVLKANFESAHNLSAHNLSRIVYFNSQLKGVFFSPLKYLSNPK